MKTIKLENVTIEISDKQYEELLMWAKPETKRWKPSVGEKLWYVDDWGDIDWYYWADTKSGNWHYNQGNCFKTKEEADEYKKYLEAYARIKQSSSFEPDWKDEYQDKWAIYYSYIAKELDFSRSTYCQYPVPAYYATEEEAELAIKDYGEDYKLILGVKK